jgi:hypothetical protein
MLVRSLCGSQDQLYPTVTADAFVLMNRTGKKIEFNVAGSEVTGLHSPQCLPAVQVALQEVGHPASSCLLVWKAY